MVLSVAVNTAAAATLGDNNVDDDDDDAEPNGGWSCCGVTTTVLRLLLRKWRIVNVKVDLQVLDPTLPSLVALSNDCILLRYRESHLVVRCCTVEKSTLGNSSVYQYGRAVNCRFQSTFYLN